MLNFIKRFFDPRKIIATFLPIIVDNLIFKARTIEKKDGFYLNIFLSIFEFKILDTDIKLSEQSTKTISKKETLTLESPIDEVRTNQPDTFGNLDKIGKGEFFNN